ncbi:MAG: hypothetical protein ABIK65_15910 [Candidatus Eisenbacteria bacterium]
MKPIGIRRETKNRWERRVPLTPEVVAGLVKEGVPVLVEPSEIRIFPDGEYAKAGATLTKNLSPCGVVFGVKEIPEDRFLEGQGYVFFSHTIKGQSYNMAMLRRMMDLRCHLIDYERIVDEKGRRLVLFGYHAGLSGMIETLRAVGLRLKADGFDTPLAGIKQPREYDSLGEAKKAIAAAGERIRAGEWPGELRPYVIGFAGYGNVSRGAQEIFELLRPSEVKPAGLAAAYSAPPAAAGPFVKVVFYEKDMVVPLKEGAEFALQDYYDHPENYRGIFERYLPHLSVLVSAIFWTDRYPRLVTKKWLKEAWASGAPRLRVIGDIACDLDGAIECTYLATEPGTPNYVYEPAADRHVDGVVGEGPVIMAVDILPAELPREASEAFSEALAPFVRSIAEADFGADPRELDIPGPIRNALIVHRGELTEEYHYLTDHVGRE